MMPILPFLEDTKENIGEIVHQARENGVSYIIPAFGVSLRPGSRDYFYQKLDLSFPGIKEKYIQEYGDNYQCSAPNWRELKGYFEGEMDRLGLPAKIPVFEPRKRSKGNKQMPLFSEELVE